MGIYSLIVWEGWPLPDTLIPIAPLLLLPAELEWALMMDDGRASFLLQ